MSEPNQAASDAQALAGQADRQGQDNHQDNQKIDFLSGEYPEAVVRAARDMADLASFAHSVSDNGQDPGKLIDAVKMLILIQDEEYATGSGVGGHLGLLNRFVERWGCQPKTDSINPLGSIGSIAQPLRRECTCGTESTGFSPLFSGSIAATIERALKNGGKTTCFQSPILRVNSCN